jgi:hypothetical protein
MTYEYKEETIYDSREKDIIKSLNELGRGGWRVRHIFEEGYVRDEMGGCGVRYIRVLLENM